MPKRIPEQECIDRLNAIEGIKFVRLVGEYVGVAKSRAVMVCDHGHEWNAVVDSIIRGCGCRKCANFISASKRTISKECREHQLSNIKGMIFVGWADAYKNNTSKAVMLCKNGHEWSSSVKNIIRGDGCHLCAISNRSNIDRAARADRERQLNSIAGMKFIGWACDYKNRYSKAIMECDCGNVFESSIANILQGKICPKCANINRANAHKITKEYRENQLNSLNGKVFVGWCNDSYVGALSRAVMRCNYGHEWDASVDSLINSLSGCPFCHPGGFSNSLPGTCYMLMSDCGNYVKVGISNNHKRRIRELRKATPFAFDVIEFYNNEDGKEIARLEKEFHGKYESAGFSGFDGATEWLKFSPELLEEFRLLGE